MSLNRGHNSTRRPPREREKRTKLAEKSERKRKIVSRAPTLRPPSSPPFGPGLVVGLGPHPLGPHPLDHHPLGNAPEPTCFLFPIAQKLDDQTARTQLVSVAAPRADKRHKQWQRQVGALCLLHLLGTPEHPLLWHTQQKSGRPQEVSTTNNTNKDASWDSARRADVQSPRDTSPDFNINVRSALFDKSNHGNKDQLLKKADQP